MPQGRGRYGIDTNPFELGPPLDPFRNPAAAAARLPIDGFKQLPAIKAKMQKGRADNLPVCILITGPRGSGRRTLESAIFQSWCEISNVDLGRFAMVRARAINESERELLQAWVGQLTVRLRGFIGLPDPGVIQELTAAASISDLVLLRTAIQGLLPRVYGENLKKARPSAYGIGPCFGEVRKKMVDGVCSMFQDTPQVCVITESEQEPFGENFRPDIEGLSLSAPMGHLTGEEIGDLVRQRWGPRSDIPFDLPTVQDFFKERNRYLGVVLSRLFSLFERMCAAHAGDGGVWPDDQSVFYGPDQVKATLEQIERGI